MQKIQSKNILFRQRVDDDDERDADLLLTTLLITKKKKQKNTLTSIALRMIFHYM